MNVLEWMKNEAFVGRTRLQVKLVRGLRSDVRNTWAHSPRIEQSGENRGDCFEITANFLEDLKEVFPSNMTQIEKCQESIKNLKINGIPNLDKSKEESPLLYNLLNQIKEELEETKQDQLTNKMEIGKITSCLNDCQKRMKEFEKLKFSKNENEVELRSCLPEMLRNFTGREKEIKDILKSVQTWTLVSSLSLVDQNSVKPHWQSR